MCRATPFIRVSILLAVLFISLYGCKSTDLNEFPDDEINSDIVADPSIRPSTINAEVFLDATTSMSGYAQDPNGTYIKFISELEAAVAFGTRNSTINYYKFGTQVKQINRNEAVFQSKAFYREKGIFERTSIDSVLVRADEAKSTIILTDLFQSEGDINQIVEQFKTRCFSKGLGVGILMVPAEFNGIVYDAKVAPFKYSSTQADINTYRPFYAIFVGKAPDFLHLIDALKSTAVKDVVLDDNIILLRKQVVYGYEVKMEKNKDPQYRKVSQRWISRGYSGKNPFKNIFRVTLSRGEKPVPIVVTIDNIRPAKYLPEINLNNIDIEVIKMGTTKEQISSNDEFQTVECSSEGSKITLNLLYNPKFEGKSSSYKMLYGVSALRGFKVPEAFTQYSSLNPNPTSDANKTLNLEKFVTDLIRTYMSINTGYIAKSYLYLDYK